MATATIEDYLMAIYTLDAEGEAVIGARLAQLLGVRPPTVTATLHRMERDRLATFRAGKRIALTDGGRRQAEGLLRRHRLLERWLADVLGIDWQQCHLDAHRLEHGLTEQLADRLSVSLGHPATCPHGSPIPGNPQSPTRGALQRLSQASAGSNVVIDRVSELTEYAPELLGYFQSQGLLPGTRLRVQRIEPAGGLLILEREGQQLTVSSTAADHLWVRSTV